MSGIKLQRELGIEVLAREMSGMISFLRIGAWKLISLCIFMVHWVFI